MIAEPLFDADGNFIHHCCKCGEEASFGYGVSLRRGRLGTWYCAKHQPQQQTTPTTNGANSTPCPPPEYDTERQMTDQMTVERWLAIRKEAGLQLDPETAEVEWTYAQTHDPYGVHPDLPAEHQQAGREYFARSPGSDVWVWFGDLPEATRNALWEKHEKKLAFPAGLEGMFR
jgi:hypothetical protein